MIDLYTWSTPNGYKASIALEEMELGYRPIPVNIGRGEQFTPEFLALNPNNKVPTIVDHDGPSGAPFAVFESGAILIYLAEKCGRLLPTERAARSRALQWLMFQMANVGPMLGQAHHFREYAPEQIPYAIERYTNEARRIYRVLDRRLADTEFLGGDYSIADIATFPWIRSSTSHGQVLEDHPNLARWFAAVATRPAVQRGLEVPVGGASAPIDDEAREHLFGAGQYR